MKAIIVTGDRHAESFDWWITIDTALARLDRNGRDHMIVIHGAAPGVDLIAAGIAEKHPFLTNLPFPADWRTHGKGAGPRRNEAMLRVLLELRTYGHTVSVQAFHNNLKASKGTKHMTSIALAAGVPVRLHASDKTSVMLA